MTWLDPAAAFGRRKFLAGLAGIVAGLTATMAGVPAAGHAEPATGAPQPLSAAQGQWVVLGSVAGLVPGAPVGFPFSRKAPEGWVEPLETGVAYVVTHDGLTFEALSNVCTHRGCRVCWAEERQAFVCPCHAGLFDVDGEVLSGPPPRPLDRLPSRVRDGQIEIFVEAQA